MSFRSLFNRNPTRHFPRKEAFPLEWNLTHGSMNGVVIGATIEECSVFGRAAVYRNIYQDLHWLEYPQLGLIVSINESRIEAFDCPVSSPEHYTRDPDFRCATPTIRQSGLTLHPEISEEDLVNGFGPPTERDEEEDELVLAFERNGIYHEFEFGMSEGESDSSSSSVRWCLHSFSVSRD